MENFSIYTLDNWQEKKEKILSSLPDLTDTHIITNHGINSNYTDYFDYTKPSYYDTIIECVSNELTYFKTKIDRDIDVFSMWFETSQKFQHHQPHTHGDCGYSSVLYVSFDKKYHQATKFYLDEEYQPNIDEGNLIIFPSNVLHEAPQNTSEIPRTIVSFNIKLL